FCFSGIAMAHSRISARSLGRSSIRSDGLIPHSQTRKDVRWHVERVRYPRRDGSITLSSGQAALGERRIIVAMDQIMNDAGMICVLFPQLFQDGGCLELLRQTRVVGRGVTYSEDSERVEGLGFEIVWILVAELPHCFLVGNHPVARSHWSMTRLPDRTCVRTVWRIVIDIERGDESTLAICAGVHRHR